MNIKLSVSKEKAIVCFGAVTAAISGYLIGTGYVAEGALIAAISTAITTFWSEGVNTA